MLVGSSNCQQLRFLGRCHAGIVVEDVFNAFAVAAFFEFVVFAIFEMRYLLLVWRARRANSLDAWAAQRELSVLYARFYGVLLAGVFLGYQLHLCAHLTTPVLAVLQVCHVWVSEQNQEPRSAVLIDRCASSTVPLKLGITPLKRFSTYWAVRISRNAKGHVDAYVPSNKTPVLWGRQDEYYGLISKKCKCVIYCSYKQGRDFAHLLH